MRLCFPLGVCVCMHGGSMTMSDRVLRVIGMLDSSKVVCVCECVCLCYLLCVCLCVCMCVRVCVCVCTVVP